MTGLRWAIFVAVVFTFLVAQPVLASPSRVVVSEFRFRGPDGGNDEYVELLNARWKRGGVTFATLHVVGSNNNRPTAEEPSIGDESEYQARNAANLEWLEQTFDAASKYDRPAVMIVIQANIFEEDDAEPSGFTEFKAALEEETTAFGKPVVLVHGDSHTFRIDKPAISEQRLLNFTRVETFGSPDVHWVRASVDTRDPEVFTFQPEIIEENTTTPWRSSHPTTD